MTPQDLSSRLAKLSGELRLVSPSVTCPRCGTSSGFDVRQLVNVFYAIQGEAEDSQSQRSMLVDSNTFVVDALRAPKEVRLLCGDCREEFPSPLPIRFL